MTSKSDLVNWVVPALKSMGDSGTVTEVCRFIWTEHEAELRDSDDLFYTWQYDVRWAAQKLRDEKVLAPYDPKDRRWKVAGGINEI